MPGLRDDANSRLFIFIVDTDTYAGGFERPLTAFCTGCIGECGVGEDYADVFRQECPNMVKAMEDLVVNVTDDRGCSRPTTIWSTPGYWNDGMGAHYRDDDWGTPEVIERYRQSVREYKAKYPNGLPGTDAETALPSRNPAYQSVAMFLHKRPSNGILKFLIERVKAFKPISKFDGTCNAIGFRLIQTEVVEKVLWQESP